MQMDQQQMETLALPLMDWKKEAFAIGVRDVPPQLAIQFDGSDEIEPVPDWILSKAFDKTGTVGRAVSLVLRGIAEKWPDFTKYRLVMLATDGYTRHGDSIPERGELGDDFRNNPASDVTECMTLVVASDDLVGGVDVQMVRMPYVVTDGGVMEFKEPTYYFDDVGGDVVEHLKEVFHAVQG